MRCQIMGRFKRIDVLAAVAVSTLCMIAIDARPAAAQTGMRTTAEQAELDQLAKDFNAMYVGRNPVVIVLNGPRNFQKQTFLGPYEKNGEGDYVQKNLCETTGGGIAAVGVAEGVQRLTVENGDTIVQVVYQYKGQEPEPCPPAAVKRLGNGIIFEEIDDNGGGWHSNEFYITRDGRHESIRRFDGTGEGELFAEAETKESK